MTDGLRVRLRGKSFRVSQQKSFGCHQGFIEFQVSEPTNSTTHALLSDAFVPQEYQKPNPNQAHTLSSEIL